MRYYQEVSLLETIRDLLYTWVTLEANSEIAFSMDRYKKEDTTKLGCSFCEKDQQDVNRLIGGPSIFICDECVHLCTEVLHEDDRATLKSLQSKPHNMTPRRIHTILNDYVIGQEEAKKHLSVAIYNHYKRTHKLPMTPSDVEISKSNIMLIGPTGCGKTLLAQTLARILDVPFAIADATTLTQAGYVGEDVENIILKLVQAADHNLEKAKQGIIYIDEVDKLSRKSENPSITRDVSGEGVQQALLKLVEGTVASIPAQGGRKHPQQEYIRFDTKDVLIIIGGSFDGLEAIIQKRLQNQSSIGFEAMLDPQKGDSKKSQNFLHLVETEDLLAFGMIPEFIGRFPVVVSMNPLDETALKEILTTPRNALIKQYQALFAMDHATLLFEEEALNAIVQKALDQKTGARGLRSILDHLLLETMYHLPDHRGAKSVTITQEVVLGQEEPLLDWDEPAVMSSS